MEKDRRKSLWLALLAFIGIAALVWIMFRWGKRESPPQSPAETIQITLIEVTGSPAATGTIPVTPNFSPTPRPTRTPTPIEATSTPRPTRTDTPTPRAALCVHTVISGDTISYIVLNCEQVTSPGDLRVLWNRVCEDNGIADCNKIYVGDIVEVFP